VQVPRADKKDTVRGHTPVELLRTVHLLTRFTTAMKLKFENTQNTERMTMNVVCPAAATIGDE
jgi:hypothetical protein